MTPDSRPPALQGVPAGPSRRAGTSANPPPRAGESASADPSLEELRPIPNPAPFADGSFLATDDHITNYRVALHQALVREQVLRDELARFGQGLRWLLASRGWRVLSTLRRIRGREASPDRVFDLIRAGGPDGTTTVLRSRLASRASGTELTADYDISLQGLAFPKRGEPMISIIIPTYNMWRLTVGCLRSIRATTTTVPYEVIVSDDGSTDGTASQLAAVPGLRLTVSADNRGFCAAANAGAACARGQYLFFLNNDTELTAGWAEALLDAAAGDAVGAVGCKLVYPDGRLQEAGGIIWNDGTGMNFGRGDDPARPVYNFRRRVDYCSAAALLVRRDLFEAIGGFDMRYAPGYYEDTDLCFHLRKEGYEVVYEPGAVVVHIEGSSFGSDLSPVTMGRHRKTSQEVNRHVFVAKWRTTLLHHYPPGTAAGLLGGRRSGRHRILLCDHGVPTPDRDSGSQRLWWLAQIFQELQCDVTMFPADGVALQPYTADLQRRGIEVASGQSFAEFARSRIGLFDTVWVSRRDVAEVLIPEVRRWFPRATVIYDTVDLHFVREEREEDVLGVALDRTAREMRRQREAELVASADLSVVVSQVEADAVAALVPDARVVVVSNVHPLAPLRQRSFAERSDVLFVGGFAHSPNVDAVNWFVQRIWPRVRRVTGAHFWVVGADPPLGIRRLESESVSVVGHVPDLRWYLERSRISVAPLRYGAGVKGKVGQAMAAGVPVVTTSVGAEGMGLIDGEHALIRDTEDQFVEAVSLLYQDARLWETLAAGGRAIMEARYQPMMVRRQLAEILGIGAASATGVVAPTSEVATPAGDLV